VLEDAGRLSIPFTSGLLIGIGETLVERIETLLALRETHRRYGHLQEVIVQNFRAKPDTAMRQRARALHRRPGGHDRHRPGAAGPKVHLQAPPNLSPGVERAVLAAGIDDWGGVSPITPDHVNPEAPWPHLDALASAAPRRASSSPSGCASTPSTSPGPIRGWPVGCARRSRRWPTRWGWPAPARGPQPRPGRTPTPASGR
jgi:FO synthase